MGDDDLESAIAATSSAVKALISKPKMSAKLLKKPPFRFLHDVVMAIDRKTGIVEGLFPEELLNSKNVKEKAAKIEFLTMLITFLGECGRDYATSARPSKIVAGMEPAKTNDMLQALARAASSVGSFDREAAVRRALGQEEAAEPAKKSKKKSRKKGGGESKEADEEEGKEEEKPKAKQRASKQKNPSKKAAAFKADLSAVDGEIATTEELLGSLFRKPKMTEKLLSRPPFRYLHDIITATAKATGFPSDLYSGDELNAKSISGKADKIAFLQKLIDCVGLLLGTAIEARPEKIVAGRDATSTNKLLQCLGIAARAVADGKVDGSAAVRAVLAGKKQGDTLSGDGGEEKEEEEERTKTSSKARRSEKDDGEEKEEERERPARSKKTSEKERPSSEEKKPDSKRKAKKPVGASRPQTARKRPPKLKDNVTATEVRPGGGGGNGSGAQRAVGVMGEGEDDDDSEEDDENGPSEDGKNYGETKKEDASSGLRGKLVRDILMEEKAEDGSSGGSDAEAKVSIGISMGKIGRSAKRGGSKLGGSGGGASIDTEALRSAIQLLCQSTNPLGKCIDYVHEDMETMNAELDQWHDMYLKNCELLEEEERLTEDALQPYRARLAEVKEKIKTKHAMVGSVRASIAKNDQRIAELLRDMVGTA